MRYAASSLLGTVLLQVTGQRHSKVKCSARGSRQQETEQPPIPLGLSHTKVGPMPLPASPLWGWARQAVPWGQTCCCRRTKSEGKIQSKSCFHLRLLSQQAYKRVSRSFAKLKCLEKPKEVHAAFPSKGCALPPLPTKPPWEVSDSIFFLQKSD